MDDASSALAATPRSVLVLGGYGLFGERIVRLLCHHGVGHIIIAGRRGTRAKSLIRKLAPTTTTKLEGRRLNVHDITARTLTELGRPVVVNATGPFHNHDYTLPKACIAAGAPYVDIADHRDYVRDITELNTAATAAGVPVISGASTVPALSSAALDHLISSGLKPTHVEYGISPGNRTRRSPATIASILAYVGRPFTTLIDGKMQTIIGWQDMHRVDYPDAGRRWMANCNVSDLDLFPKHYPSLKSVRFSAGLELGLLHVPVGAMAALVRATGFRHLDKITPLVQHLSSLLRPLGTDVGGMHVILTGQTPDGETHKHKWFLIARNGHGPYMPAVPASILAHKLAADPDSLPAGARSAVSAVTLDEVMSFIAHLDITLIEPDLLQAPPQAKASASAMPDCQAASA